MVQLSVDWPQDEALVEVSRQLLGLPDASSRLWRCRRRERASGEVRGQQPEEYEPHVLLSHDKLFGN